MEKICRPKIKKKTEDLNNTVDQMDLIDIQRAFYPTAAEHTSCQAHTDFLQDRSCEVTKQVLRNLRRLKSHQGSF